MKLQNKMEEVYLCPYVKEQVACDFLFDMQYELERDPKTSKLPYYCVGLDALNCLYCYVQTKRPRLKIIRQIIRRGLTAQKEYDKIKERNRNEGTRG